MPPYPPLSSKRGRSPTVGLLFRPSRPSFTLHFFLVTFSSLLLPLIMRIKRSLQLWPETANVHLFWRCHNREFYLNDDKAKDLYMGCVEESLDYKMQGNDCHIHAFCVMDNHFHQSVTYFNGSNSLSNFMRYAHGLFGARYNRKEGRSGKVAEGRPKTPRVQNDYHAMQLHFYIEANPIRAKIRTIQDLKHYRYSSYGFYAYGIKTSYTARLTMPPWYIELGETDHARRKKYRRLFRDYLEANSSPLKGSYLKAAIGDIQWLEALTKELKEKIKTMESMIVDQIKPIFSG